MSRGRAACPDCGKRARVRPAPDGRGFIMAAHTRPGDAEVSPWQTCIDCTRIPAEEVDLEGER